MFNRCELLLWEGGIWGRGYLGNPEEGERPPLEAATEDVTLDTSVCVYNSVSRALSKSPINPIINPNPVYSHSITRLYFYYI
jgi:hypothetical protein